MKHFHGLPITPATACYEAIKGGCAFVSYMYPDQLSIALESASSIAVDNGAFSAWKSGKPITDWSGYYEWVRNIPKNKLDFFVIPDVIDGTEKENDALLWSNPWRNNWVGAPVFHLNESMDRLQSMLNAEWQTICLGSAGDYDLGTPNWVKKMDDIFELLTDGAGRPRVRVHGLRMLNPKIVSEYPFYSCDSTNIGRNVGIDSKWKGTYTPPTKELRAKVMRERIESTMSPCYFEKKRQMDLI